jgi:sugar transferase (PEP-CTERM/EpsH1 system associated)
MNLSSDYNDYCGYMEKILFISQRIPYPPNKGCKIRSFHEVKFFAQNYKIDLITFIDDKNDYQYTGRLKQLCDNLYTFPLNKWISLFKGILFLLIGKSASEGYYFSFKVKRLVSQLVNTFKYKFIFCYSSQTAQYALASNTVKIMDFCDVDSEKFLQYSRKCPFPLKIFYKLESKRLSKYENKIYSLFDKSIFITPAEAAIFKKNRALPKIYTIGNGLDYNYFKPIKAEKKNALVFTGDMSYYANIDGVYWFCKKVFPGVVKKIPDIKLYIVGRNPTKTIKNLENTNVIVTGEVPDVRPYLARAKMAVIPLRIARGLQNKVFEAMAMAIPVIISEDLFYPLTNIGRDNIFIYRNKKSLIRIIVESINNDALLEKRGKHHRKYVVNNLNWNSIIEQSPIWSDL